MPKEPVSGSDTLSEADLCPHRQEKSSCPMRGRSIGETLRLSGLEQDHITVFQALGHVDDTLIPTAPPG